MTRTTALAALVLAGASLAPPATAQPAPFVPRETHPYDCASMAGAPTAWSGAFSGRKEVGLGLIRYRDTLQKACFVSERECRNWLYNMQSEYTVMVWRAECRPGLG